MINPETPAFPESHPGAANHSRGITTRAYFAAMAMQGLLASDESGRLTYSSVSESAVKMADALIEELNK